MATRKEDERGITLHQVMLSFIAIAESPTRWNGFFRDAGIELNVHEEEWSVSLIALPEEPEPQYYLWVGCHPHGDGKETHFSISLSPVPQSSPPPEEVVSESKQVGGYPNVLARLGEQWSGFEVRDPSLTVDYDLPKSSWDASALQVTQTRSSDGLPSLEPVLVGWRFRPTVDIVTAVMVATGHDAVKVSAKASEFEFEMNEELISSLDNRVWRVLKQFLKRRT